MRAFETALRERPLDKVSVTALSAEAEINKATFYLHYRDVYDLASAYVRLQAEQAVEEIDYAEAFFNDPSLFASRLIDDFERRKDDMKVLGDNWLMHLFMDEFATRLGERLDAVQPPPDDLFPHIMLMFILSGILGLLPRYVDTQGAEVREVVGTMLTAINEEGRKRAEAEGRPLP